MCISEIGNFKKCSERPLHASMLIPSILSVDEDTEKLVLLNIADGKVKWYSQYKKTVWQFPVAQMVKNLPANAGDPGLIPGLARYPRERNGYPLQCSCLENSMDRSVWRATDSSWDHKESDTNEQLIFSHFHFFASLNGSVTLSNCFIFLTQFTLFIKWR